MHAHERSSHSGDEYEKLPKKTKKEQKREARKQAERKRIADKRAKARVQSFSDNSDVISSEILGASSYYFENGLRKVYPYAFKHSTHAKGRWVGHTLCHIMSKEFAKPEKEVLSSIDMGRTLVNGRKIDRDYIIRENDLISNQIHRHESPVTARPVRIIANTDELLVVDKPSSIPIHPCGSYRFNSLCYILAKEQGFRNLRSLYRIDRMTSGLMMFCRTKGRANEMILHISNKNTEKIYVCRVEGKFPDGVIECQQPLGVFDPRMGLHYVTADGKVAHTTFERLSFNGRSSVVKCQPHTGRTHQIRVHLQFLGHPILNDYLYNSDSWGPNKGRDGDYGRSAQEVADDIRQKASWKKERLLEASETMHCHGDNVPRAEEKHNSVNDNNSCCDVDNAHESVSAPASKRARLDDAQADDCNETNHVDSSDNPSPNVTSLSSTSAHNTSSNITSLSSTSAHNPSPNVTSLSSTSAHNPSPNVTSLSSTSAHNPSPNVTSLSSTSAHNTSSNVTSLSSASTNSTLCTKAVACSSEANSLATSVAPTWTVAPTSEVSDYPALDASKVTFDEHCADCRIRVEDPQPSQLVMYLHAWKNKGPTWDYSTELPEWASEDWSGE